MFAKDLFIAGCDIFGFNVAELGAGHAMAAGSRCHKDGGDAGAR